MAARRTTVSLSRSDGASGRKSGGVQVILPGQHIPNPGVVRAYAQCILLLAFVLCILLPWATAWALTEMSAAPASVSTMSTTVVTESNGTAPPSLPPPQNLLPTPATVMAWLIINGYPIVYPWLALVACLGLLTIAVELAVFTMWRSIADAQVRREAATVGASLLVRLPPPGRSLGGSGGKPVEDVGDELFDSLHSAGRAVQGRWRGDPRLAFQIIGRPNALGQLQVWLPERRTPDTAQPGGGDGPLANSLRPILEGVVPGTRADLVADPLREAIQPGKYIRWADVTLTNAAEFPLRMPDDLEHDLLGPLMAAHRARPSTALVTLQIIMQPMRHELLRAAWRGRIMRRLMRLEARYEHHLEGDTKHLQAKLSGAPYRVTLRAIAVGDDPGVVTLDLDALLSTLEGQYRQVTGDAEQRLTRRGVWSYQIPADWNAPRTQRSAVQDLALALAGIAGGWALGTVVAPFLLPLLAATVRDGMAVVSDWFNPPLQALLATLVAAASRSVLALHASPALLLTVALGCSGGLVAGAVVRYRRHDGIRRQLERLIARAPRPPDPPHLLRPDLTLAPPGILTAREVEGCWSLPRAQLSSLVECLPNRYIPPPQIAFCNDEPDRIAIGLGRRADGSYAPVGPSLRDLRNIMHITAPMGTGKSRLLTNIAAQLLNPRLNAGFGLIDGKGDDQSALAYTTLRMAPLEAESRLLWVDLLDMLNPIGINPLAADRQESDHDLTLNQLLTMFARLDPTNWAKSHGMAQYAQQAGLLVIEGEQHPTLAHFKQALLSEEYRAQLLRTVRNPEVRSFWLDVFPNTGENQKTSRDALIRRVDSLLASPMLRNIFTRPIPTLNIRDAIETNQIVLIPFPTVKLGDSTARGIGSFLIREFVKGAFGRHGSDMDRKDWPLIVDELQVLIDPLSNVDLETVVTRFRGLGVPGLYAHQTLSQLGELANELVGNVLNHIILRANEPDASFYAKLYGAQGITPADVSGQPAEEHQYADLSCRGKPTRLFSYQPFMWPDVPVIELPPYHGPAWRTITAPATGKAEARLDALIGRMGLLSETARYDPLEVADYMAHSLSAEEWTQVKDRWAAHRRVQREHILAHPGCIPDHMQRRMRVSGLAYGEPRLAAIVDYLRVRQALTPTTVPAGHQRRGRGKGGKEWGSDDPTERTLRNSVVKNTPPLLAPPAPPPPTANESAPPTANEPPGEEPLMDDTRV